MTGKLIAAAAMAVLSLVVGVVGLVLGVGGASLTATPAGATSLNAASIPIPSLVPWLEKGGSLCPSVSAPFLAAQIKVESDWKPNAVSPSGAEGLAQFMPGTWPSWSANDDGTGHVTPFNPVDATMAMARYDCALAAAVAGIPSPDPTGLMLAAYNAGPNAVIAANGVPPLPGVQSYIANIEAAVATYTAALATGPGGVGSAIVTAAEQWLGTPYSWGGGNTSGPTLGFGPGAGTVGFDCSGLVLYATYVGTGGAVSLPHSSEIQVTLGQPVAKADIQPGDVIGFALGSDPTNFDHIGIYIGNNQMIDAPDTGSVVRVDTLDSYWQSVPWSIRSFS